MSKDVLPDGSLQLDEPVSLPAILDVLIVGGGPAGTAAAFRAKELGLTALVIDYDDIMKRIRDYAKSKLILPDYGGGDKMQFPQGGSLISALHFDPIDKDDMCILWKGYYQSFNIPAKIGLEITGFEYSSDGIINVLAFNHKLRKEEQIQTRHLVFALGRGVPRRFDIPGNTDGIAYRLDDPANYTGRPVCVIGGGTSAAEAVIAISNSKIASGDSCPIYWSYRGDKMPRVSKALSDVFFDAYVGNGNIRYYPNSEPVAIVTGPDREEYLTIRVDRRLIEGRSIETTHLEFSKTSCIACIGEDIPESMLNTMGIHMATGGPKNKKRMVVTPIMETQQSNVYLIGDILSPIYLETDDHAADPATFTDIRRRGNIKSALRDGVFVVEVIKQKIQGQSQIQVNLDYASPQETEQSPSDTEDSLAPSLDISEDDTLRLSNGPVEKEIAEVAPRLVRMTAGDVEEDEYTILPGARISIGQGEADVILPGDGQGTQKHATLEEKKGTFILHDEGSSSGVFIRLSSKRLRKLPQGALLQLGRQFLMFGKDQKSHVMAQYDRAGKLKQKYKLAEGTIIAGRDAPDIILDAQDMSLSRRHVIISIKEGELYAKDAASTNRTYLRVKEPVTLEEDELFRVGSNFFKISQDTAPPRKHTVFIVPTDSQDTSSNGNAPSEHPEEMPARVEQVDAQAIAPTSGEPAVTFQGHDDALLMTTSDSILDIAIDNDIPLKYECQSGSCGLDPIRIISGGEYLNEVDDEGEAWTLDEICQLSAGNGPGACRLACMTKVTGPVVVEIVKK